MFGANTIGTGLTLGKVIGGISKGLTIANQVIPLYQQAKPMISNARKAFELVKEFNSSSTTGVTKSNTSVVQPKKTSQVGSHKALPVFFQ